MTTGRRQLILTLAVALIGGAVMLATSRTPNPAFELQWRASGWPFPWEIQHGAAQAQRPCGYWLCNFAILLGASFLIGRCVRGKSVAQPTLTVLAMLTIAPLAAVTILLGCTPKGRGDLLYPIAIATYVFRGMAINWATYLPALIVAPVLMRWFSARRSFHHLSPQRLLGLSVLVGAAGGVCVVIRSVLMALDGGGAGLVLGVVFAGAASGAITLTLICLLYRRVDSGAEPGASPNGGPAMPLGNSGVTEGPPSVS